MLNSDLENTSQTSECTWFTLTNTFGDNKYLSVGSLMTYGGNTANFSIQIKAVWIE